MGTPYFDQMNSSFQGISSRHFDFKSLAFLLFKLTSIVVPSAADPVTYPLHRSSFDDLRGHPIILRLSSRITRGGGKEGLRDDE